MRKPVVLAVVAVAAVLCSAVMTCNRKDTGFVKAWPRTVEPRLTNADWARCDGPECGRAREAEPKHCDEFGDRYAEVLQMLAAAPHCTDDAITALEAHEARSLSDLAAAYYLRSFRQDRPSDLLRAFEYASDAVTAAPEDPAARFNAALIQEQLGLRREANVSWLFVALHDDSGWAEEARRHLKALRVPDAAVEWKKNLALLPAALKAGDRGAVRALIEDYRDAATEHLELRQLPAAEARLLASELSALLRNDRYFLEPDFTIAERIGDAAATVHFDPGKALAMLEPLRATARHSPYLLARIQSTRAYALSVESRFLESLRDYEESLKVFVTLEDTEKVTSVHRSMGSVYREMGRPELSLSHCLQALHDLHSTVLIRRRTIALTEIAQTVASLGYEDIALLYQNEAVRQAEAADPVNHAALSSAYRARAGIQILRGDTRAADRDLTTAIQHGGTAMDETLQRGLSVRIHETRAQAMRRVNHPRAVDEFTSALNAIPPGQLMTLRASLLTARAEAYQSMRRAEDAERDLEAALRALRDEENLMLERGSRESGEAHWSDYFSRFEDTYDRLIRLRFESDRKPDAFNVDERSRAYEPLNLILRSNIAPPEFRALVPDGEPMNLDTIRARLAPGVALLQYAVLEDRTYVWIITPSEFHALRLKAKRADVEQWAERMSRAAVLPTRSADDFHQVGTTIYNELLHTPLAHLDRYERLVIVPDGAMHGLPFAALKDDEGVYLFEKKIIEIAGSATLYVFSTMRDAAIPHTAPSALLIGDPHFDGTLPVAQGQPRLRHARAEAGYIRVIYEPRMPVATLLEDQATVPNFLRLARDRALIHIAAHALPNPRDPSRSMILFTRSPEHDGALAAEELVDRLKLDRTRLVVLAACRSAGGQPIGPEGIAPLVRPLITAGVPAVVGTLWDIDDATASILSVSFHRHYEQGMDAAKALQAAQLEMKGNTADVRQFSVFAWAPYQVVGHASPLF